MEQFVLKTFKTLKKRNNLAYSVGLCEQLKTMFPNTIFTKNINELIDEISNKINDEYAVCNSEIEERLEQLKSTLGKYWEVTCSMDSIVYWQFVIFPYMIVQANNTYWFIKGHLNDDYHSGMSDENINYMEEWIKESTITFKEITKEEFIERVNAHTNDVLNIRLEKMERRKQWLS